MILKIIIPDDQNLKNYEKSLSIYPKIKNLNDNSNDIKVIKSMLRMKKECNSVIHFNKKFAENTDVNDYIYNNYQIINDENSIELEEEEEKDEEEENKKAEEPNVDNKINIINIPNKAIQIKDKSISISNIAKFIAYGQPSISTLKKLETFSKSIKIKVKEIKKLINKLIKKKINFDVEECKK